MDSISSGFDRNMLTAFSVDLNSMLLILNASLMRTEHTNRTFQAIDQD